MWKRFLTGTFFTSLGSTTYVISLAAFLAQAGVSPIKLGILFGSVRLNGVLVNAFLGHWGDHYSPQKIVVISEVFAALGSLLIFFTYNPTHGGENWFWFFLAANLFRITFVNFQSASVQKIGKLIDHQIQSNGAMAVRMNSFSFGTILFASLISFLVFKYLKMEFVILFDFMTFLINGVIVGSLKIDGVEPKKLDSKKSLLKLNFGGYLRLFPAFALADMLLAVAFAGHNTLGTRLMHTNLQMVPVLTGIFGVMVWVSAFLLKRFGKANIFSLWPIAALGLVIQAFGLNHISIICLGASLGYLAYWLIYNSVGRDLMQSAQTSNYASLAANRNVISILILGVGEFWVGAALLGLQTELLFRASICVVGFIIFLRKRI